MPNTPITPPILTPDNTPPINYDDQNVHGFTPPSNGSSQYSSDYNDEWNNYINNPNVTTRRTRANSYDDDDFIRGRELTMDDLDGTESSEPEPQQNTIRADWAERSMPPLPSYDKQFIDLNVEGYDPLMMESRGVKEYLEEDTKDNIAILYNGKVYLSSRSTIEQQEDDALVYECLEGDKKTFQNIVGNLPLYNIKKIGLDLSSDNAVGIEAEYIYMGGIDFLLEDEGQLYSIIPLIDKQLVSVISYNESQKVGTALGSGVSALHCQAGQGGLAGIIVKAYPGLNGGGKRKKKTVKKRHYKKKTVKKSKKRSFLFVTFLFIIKGSI
jgi:hypothetical protein